MRTGLTLLQTQILDANKKSEIFWGFWVYLGGDGPIDYFWSTSTNTFESHNYEFKIRDFSPISMASGMEMFGISSPANITIKVINKDNEFTPSDFVGALIKIKLVMKADLALKTNSDEISWEDGDLETSHECISEIMSWSFRVKTASSTYQTLTLQCVDFLQQYLEGDYPNGGLINDVFPVAKMHNDNVCIPKIWGEPFFPIRWARDETEGFYVLGHGDIDLYEIRSPKEFGSRSDFLASDPENTFLLKTKTGTDGTTYDVAQFIVVDSNGDGTNDSNAMFGPIGGPYYDVPCKYSRNVAEFKTNPIEIIKEILIDFGIPSTLIDTAAYTAAYNIWDDRNLRFNVGLFYKQSRKTLLPKLLTMCNTRLVVRDKLYFKVNSNVSQHVINNSWVVKPSDVAEGSFRIRSTMTSIADGGYVSYAYKSGSNEDPIDQLVKTVVPTGSTSTSPSDITIEAEYINDSTHAQKIGILAIQKMITKEFGISAKLKSKSLQVECGDVVTIEGGTYNASTNYDVLITNMTINRKLEVNVNMSKYKDDLSDWGDLNIGAPTIQTDDSGGVFSPIISGPTAPGASDNKQPNIMHNILRIGEDDAHISLNGTDTYISIGDPPPDSYGDNEGIWLGIDSTNPKLSIYKDSDNYMQFDGDNINIGGNITAESGSIGGWTIGASSLYSNNIILDSNNNRIRSDNYVSGLHGSGFTLEPDLLEVGNIACRGIFRTATFQTDVYSAVGGNLIVSKGADVLLIDMTALDNSTLTIEGNETFSVGDILRIKSGNDDEWLEVTNSGSAPTYTVTRDKNNDYGADANPAWKKGESVINYGVDGDGFIQLSASEINAPKMGIYTHGGSPYTSLTERVRIGNLNGHLGYDTDEYGISIGEDTKYLKYDPTNGLRISSLDCILDGTNYERVRAFSISDGYIKLSETIGNLDNIDDGTNYGRILSTSISAGSIILSETIGDLDDISDGTNYGRILSTSISAGKIILSETTGDLDDIDDGDNYGRILSTSISAGSIILSETIGDLDDIDDGDNYGRILSTSISAGQIKLSETIGDLDDISDGGTYGKVKSTYLSAGQVLLVQAWGNLGDISDGGNYSKVLTTDITAGHIKLDETINGTYGKTLSTHISAGIIKLSSENSLAEGSLSGNSRVILSTSGLSCYNSVGTKTIEIKTDGDVKFGDYDNDHGMFYDNSEGDFIFKTDQSGNFQILGGGDIELIGSDTDPGVLKFIGTSYNIYLGINSDGDEFILQPGSTGVTDLAIGDPTPWHPDSGGTWKNIYIHTAETVIISADDGGDNLAKIILSSGDPGGMALICDDDSNYTQYYYVYTDKFYPNNNKQSDLGQSTHKWNQCWIYNLNEEADYLYLDDIKDSEGNIVPIDDIAIIESIKPSDKFEEFTGLRLIDDDTLPDFVLSRDKKGNIVRDSLRPKVLTALCMGAIKQLNNKIKILEEKINE